MSTKFKTPVAMKVTLEQYEYDLKEPLENLGYVWASSCNLPKDDFKEGSGYEQLVTNYHSDMFNTIGGFQDSIDSVQRFIIEEYNPKLFLAIAAMTEGDDWIVGEWLFYKDESELFECKELSGANSYIRFADNKKKDIYRKATLEELVEHFKVKGEVITIQPPIIKGLVSFPHILNKDEVQQIFDIACNTWKANLSIKWGAELMLKGKVVVNEDYYKTMREACTNEQNILFDKIFGSKEVYKPKTISFEITSKEEELALKGLYATNLSVPKEVVNHYGNLSDGFEESHVKQILEKLRRSHK